MKGYIYKYTFPDGKVYIGQTRRDPEIRHREHISPVTGPTNGGFWKAYTIFHECKFEIIHQFECDDIEKLVGMLNYAETQFITKYKANDPQYGYNKQTWGHSHTNYLTKEAKIIRDKINALYEAFYEERMTIYKSVSDKICELSPIDKVYIRRYAFPARMTIIVREKVPSVVIAPDEKVKPIAFFTKDGTLVGREYLPLAPVFKTIKVLSYGNKGDDYHKWNKERIQQIEKIVRYVETYAKEPVLYLDFRNPNDVYIAIKTVKIRLGKIDDTVFERIERISSILPQIKLMDTKVKYLDLSWEKVNYLKLDE